MTNTFARVAPIPVATLVTSRDILPFGEPRGPFLHTRACGVSMGCASGFSTRVHVHLHAGEPRPTGVARP
jgi:hypothetical protein